MHVLIVGAGRMGQFHKRTVQACGDTAETLDPYAEADHKNGASVGPIDAAIIATPISELYWQTRAALRRYDCPVLVEKPACEYMWQAWWLQRHAPHLAVGYVERANPVVQAFKQHRTTPGRLTFRRYGPAPHADANAALDLATHDIDLAEYLRLPGDTEAEVRAGYYEHTKHRSICSDDGLVADLLTRRLYKKDAAIQVAGMNLDLLTVQYKAWRAGHPLANITDAVHVHRVLSERGYGTRP